jgi:hypothetical protein
MPYIDQKRRETLDNQIKSLKEALCAGDPNPEQLLEIAGDINYCVTRLVSGLLGIPSYKKIAIITGVLQNINQELYRRLAAPYEDEKIESNGDVPEYERFQNQEITRIRT